MGATMMNIVDISMKMTTNCIMRQTNPSQDNTQETTSETRQVIKIKQQQRPEHIQPGKPTMYHLWFYQQ
jgi:hypothetical protein